jgi:hypothetical protein
MNRDERSLMCAMLAILRDPVWPRPSRAALLRMFGAGSLWGLTLGSGLIVMRYRNTGMICVDDVVTSMMLSLAAGNILFGPLLELVSRNAPLHHRQPQEGRMPYAYTLALAALLSLGFSAARAESPEEQNACFLDAQRICPETIPNRDRVFACLVSNKGKLSKLCRTAIDRDATASSKK